jgi:hypothetical protein
MWDPSCCKPVMSHEYIYYQNVQILHDAIIIKTKFLLPQAYMTLADFCYPVLLLPKSLNYIWLSNLSTLRITDEGYSRNGS